jgi:hypothetical protein
MNRQAVRDVHDPERHPFHLLVMEAAMLKQLKMVTPIVLLGYGAMAPLPALAQGAFPRSELDFQNMFWSERMMTAMDSNKDGMVSRDEFMSYMGKQYDRMDAGKKGMLSKPQFMDTKMMRSTFPASGD